MNYLKRILLYLFVLILALVIISFGVLWYKSPGTPDAIIDKNGTLPQNAISEIIPLDIEGVEQFIILRGEDENKPILLFLHGGPGSPELPFMKNEGLNLEEHFVVAYWEQRGAGKSYSEDIPEESMTVGQMIKDAVQVTEYLLSRFDQRKTYLMGHSWGSFLGTLLAFEHPNYYHNYMGIGQIGHQYLSEQISFEWVKQQAKLLEDKSAFEALSTLTLPDTLAPVQEWSNFLMIEREYVNKFGGGMRREGYNMSSAYMTFLFNAPEYTISEKMNILEGIMFSSLHLFDDVLSSNLIGSIDTLLIPVHIFQGIHDYQTVYEPAKAFYDQLKAPEKNLHTFENSAHFPFLDETDKFNSIIEKIATRDQ